MTRPTYVVAVHFQIKPEHREDFRVAVLRQAARSLNREAGCHQFDVSVDAADETRFFLYETYTDETAFAEHRETEYFAEFARTVEPWVAGKQLSCCNLLELPGDSED